VRKWGLGERDGASAGVLNALEGGAKQSFILWCEPQKRINEFRGRAGNG